ncbi:g9673 [Coccomyxa elongata]
MASAPKDEDDGGRISSSEAEVSEDEDCDDNEEEDEGEESDEDDGDVVRRKGVKKAAAAMAVGIGSFSDPDDVPGLSHYLEHMLFMGSEQFPDENDYDAYLQSHGGSANAFTELEFTNYHFDCKPDALYGALRRFSQFFVAPLCKADALEREVNAVDNEFSGVQQDDTMRLAQLRCHTSRDGHIYRKFTWGNKKSLVTLPAEKSIDVRSQLVQYYKQNYSAERMCLTVLGGEPLDTLQEWITELFMAVPSGSGPRPEFSHVGLPFTGGRLHLMPAVRQGHQLTVTFQLPSLLTAYREKAEDYISHLVGHEGNGSLLSALKAAGLASSLSAGVSESGYERNSALFVFDVTITLTEAGLHAAPGFGLATVGPLFGYLRMLRTVGPQRWVFDELAAIADLKFRFAEEEDACEYVSRLAADMPHYAPEHVLCGPHLYDNWNPCLVTDLLERMTPASARFDLQTSAFTDILEKQNVVSQPGASSGIEPWFELPYVSVPLSPELVKSWEEPSEAMIQGLSLPPPNHYIPTDFSLRSSTADANESSSQAAQIKEAAATLLKGISMENQQAATGASSSNGHVAIEPLAAPPLLIADAPGLQVWHKLDSSFGLPKAVAYVNITSKAAYESARAAAATHLTLKLLEDMLCETTYLADVAGLSYDAWPEGLCGIEVKVEGFSHRLALLISSIVQQLVSLKADPQSFDRIREALVRKYENANMKPDRHASYLRLRALKHLWHVDDILLELKALTPAAVQEFLPSLFRDTHITTLLQGNLTVDDAMEIASSVRAAIPGGILPASERPLDSVTMLQQGCSLLHRAAVKNPEEDCSVAEVYCMAGPNETRMRAKLDLLEQLLSEPFYDQLRTKEQLGYSVHASTRLTHGILGFDFVVVSATHGPQHLDERIEAFLTAFAARLETMSVDEVDDNRQSLIAAKTQKDHTLVDEADRNWEQISSKRYDFLARELEVAALEDITLEELQEVYKALLVPGGSERRKLAVHIVGKPFAEELTSAVPDACLTLPDIAKFWEESSKYAPVVGTIPRLEA